MQGCVDTESMVERIGGQLLHPWMATRALQLHKDVLEHHEDGIVLSVLQIEKTNISHVT